MNLRALLPDSFERTVMDPLQERIGDRNAGRILDVATGHGGFLKTLADWFRDFSEGIGVDPKEDRIETAAKDADSRLQFRVMDAEQLAFEDGYFDTVAIRHSLHHLRNADKVLAEMMRVLKPGGLLIVGEVIQDPETEKPNSQRHIHHWWGKVDQARGVPHFATFTKDEVVAITRPLSLADEQIIEYFEESTEDEEAEFLEYMIDVSEKEIQKLRESGDQPELLAEGERLVDLYRREGYVDEKLVYVFGRKPS